MCHGSSATRNQHDDEMPSSLNGGSPKAASEPGDLESAKVVPSAYAPELQVHHATVALRISP